MVERIEGQKKRILSWDEVVNRILIIAAEIKQSKMEFNSIYGIPRGGQVVAVLLSHKIDLPIVDRTGINAKTLMVDDISDTGNTLDDASELFKIKWDTPMHCAVLQQRVTTEYPANFVGENISDESWQQYPWEISEEN